MLFFLESLQIISKSVSLQCVFHSIRFKVNKGWSTAVLLFFMPIRFPISQHSFQPPLKIVSFDLLGDYFSHSSSFCTFAPRIRMKNNE